ncbi:MAG: MFS transporter [Acidobacteria bacterium]|nr:MFS transporter [Acidobacteriota bacterium]
MSKPWRMLAWLSVAEFLGMTLWFSATAVVPALAADFRLDDSTAAWMTMSVQAGFVVGTLTSALLNLSDVLRVRRLFALGCVLGAAANGGIAWASGSGQVIVLRFVTGVALAAVYPPGMKIAAGWFDKRRGSALGVLIGALTIGTAFPHLLSALGGAISWRILILSASGLALVSALVILVAVDDGPYVAASAPFNPHVVRQAFTTRGTRLAILGYLGHMWELYAMWAWVAVFASFGLTGAAGSQAGSLAAFMAIGSGVIGCVWAGFVADRVGKPQVAGAAMMASGACAALSGFAFHAPAMVLDALLLMWGITIVADSAQFSALVADYSPREYVGTALTIQTCLGFLLTMASIRLLPVVASFTGWQWVFVALVPGPVLGTVAMWRLGAGRLGVERRADARGAQL